VQISLCFLLSKAEAPLLLITRIFEQLMIIIVLFFMHVILENY
jgi:hypothetical protein